MAPMSNLRISTLKRTVGLLDMNENAADYFHVVEWFEYFIAESKITKVRQVYKSMGAKYDLGPLCEITVPTV